MSQTAHARFMAAGWRRLAVERIEAHEDAETRLYKEASAHEATRDDSVPRWKYAEQVKQTARAEVERDRARVVCEIVSKDAPDVWYWQGRDDHPESLSCPVVMEAATLRAMLARLAAADSLAAAAKVLLVTNAHGVDENSDECPEAENGPDIGCTCVEGRLSKALARYLAATEAK